MAIGLGVGCLLHWFVPAIDLGIGTLIGVVTLGGCFLWLSRISTLEALYGDDTIEVSDTTWSTTPQTVGIIVDVGQEVKGLGNQAAG